ncbi:MAG: CooT family nickel-binding protein [Nitrospiraceae bacterium]|nr:MAG: CooT family nickel-binding protein [Nitrospiraceae bacterium]
MCDTNAYVDSNGNEELYFENVNLIRPEDGRVYLKNLFGEEKIFEGSIKEISLNSHKVILKKD